MAATILALPAVAGRALAQNAPHSLHSAVSEPSGAPGAPGVPQGFPKPPESRSSASRGRNTFESVAERRGWNRPGNPIERTVARKAGDLSNEDVQDIAMQVMTDIWRAWDTIEDLDALIYTTATNRIIDFKRHEAKKLVDVERDEHRNVIISGEEMVPHRSWRQVKPAKMVQTVNSWYMDGNEDDVDRDMPSVRQRQVLPEGFTTGTPTVTEDRSWMYDAIEDLSPAQRTAFQMRYFEGMAVKDIASTLKITPGAVSDRLNKAMKALRAAGAEG